MNVFRLDEDMKKSAEYTCNKHVVKMITEHTQLLCSAYYYTNQNELSPYKLSHRNHPISKWVRSSLSNWIWLRDYTIVLYEEYKYRYFNRNHRAGETCKSLVIPNLIDIGDTKMPCAMPIKYIVDSVVESYRNYYSGDKIKLLIYTGRNIPHWVNN